MSKLLPYFRWYAADAETDENYSSLTDAELGFFHRCLNKSWINEGLPADLDRLAATMRVTKSQFAKVWPAVSKCFMLTDGDQPRWVNRRQEEERSLAVAKSKKASDSVRSRYVRSSDDPLRAYGCGSVSESESPEGVQGKPTAPLPPLQTQHEYPETLAVIRERDTAADPMFCLRLAHAVAQRVASQDPPWPEEKAEKAVSDKLLAHACRESYATPGRKKNHGTGLLLTTVPNIVIGGKTNYA